MIAAFAVVRWLHETSLMVLFGSAALLAIYRVRLPGLVLPQAGWRLGLACAAAISAVLWLCFATAQMAGTSAAMFDPAILWRAASATLFGQIFLARLALLLGLCLALALGSRESLVAGLSGLALALLAITSHAAEASPAHFAAIGSVSDGLHLLTGGFWIGGLVVLALLFARGTDRLAQATTLFAEWGIVAVALLAMTGFLNAATILLGGEGHDTPLYLAVLGAKLAGVAAMVALALDNHFRWLPRLARDGVPGRLGVNIRWELGTGLAVVLLAALLGLLPPTQ